MFNEEKCLSENEKNLKKKFVLPETTPSGFFLKSAAPDGKFVHYVKGNLHCGISLQKDGKWQLHYGTVIPCGASLKKEYAESLEEAVNQLRDIRDFKKTEQKID